tara:strand:- start:602 stop:997 length:396 start_codon:yes stop_codon:yes gene_type:complete
MIRLIGNDSFKSKFGYFVTECDVDNSVKGVYVLCERRLCGRLKVLYVGQGKVRNRINQAHSRENNINTNWTNGIVIDCDNKIFRTMLEKILIHILKPKNNKSIPKIHHLILSELIATEKNIIQHIEQEYYD